MKRFLLTGMPGTGKSTVIGELVARGYKAVDADSDEFSQWVEVEGSSDAEVAPVDGNRDWMWREDRMQDLLSTEDTDVLFVSGCAENMPKFFPQFDLIILLSAPASVIVQRLQTWNTPLRHHHAVHPFPGLSKGSLTAFPVSDLCNFLQIPST